MAFIMLLAPAMEAYHRVPFERFERYSPYGTPEDVAAFLASYVQAGCGSFNLIPCAADADAAIAGVARVKALLSSAPSGRRSRPRRRVLVRTRRA
jgi:hypothetical protein